MAELTGKAISELPAATTIGNSDLIALSQNGESKKITPSVLLSGVESEISGLNSLLSTYVRPNLLDNWYFVGGGSQLGDGVFPINQRGQTSYSGAGYYIDRWTNINMTSANMMLQSNGLRFKSTSTGRASIITEQRFSNGVYNNLKGKTVTCSVLVPVFSAGSLIVQVGWQSLTIDHAGLFTLTASIPSDFSFTYGVRFYTGESESGSDFVISAVKLELGNTQTLAHQVESSWVLNEIPNYADELVKCQRYYIVCGGFFPGYGYNASTFMASISLPVTMVKAPTVSASGTGYFIQDSGHSIASVSNTGGLFDNGVRISGSATTVDVNKMGFVSGLTITLSAEL